MACAWLAAVVLGGPVLTFVGDGRPVRFGVPVPRAVLVDGLSLKGRGVLQWRRLPVGPPDADPVWIELAVVAPRGSVRVVPGGVGPSPDGAGAAFVCRREKRRVPHGLEQVVQWHWVDGTVDERSHTTFTASTTIGGETYGVGESLSRATPELGRRAAPWAAQRFGEAWARCAGLLPPSLGPSRTLRRVRRHLAGTVDELVEMGGVRGAGDYRRGDGEVTNLEFDTTFALLRCAVATGHEGAYARALRGAAHLRDRDLDQRSGLPCMHGDDHRSAAPEPGHVWLEGLLWVGLVTADDDAIEAARSLARSLVSHPPIGEGPHERLRDYAWPLLQLEALLVHDPQPLVAAAADRLATSIGLRFAADAGTWQFGEGRREHGVWFERGWLTAGILVPALRRHLRRRSDAHLEEQLARAERWLIERIGHANDGLPTHWRVGRSGAVFAEHREGATARATWLLEAVPPRELRPLLRRRGVQRAVADVPMPEHVDLATEFTLIARCDWVWR